MSICIEAVLEVNYILDSDIIKNIDNHDLMLGDDIGYQSARYHLTLMILNGCFLRPYPFNICAELDMLGLTLSDESLGEMFMVIDEVTPMIVTKCAPAMISNNITSPKIIDFTATIIIMEER